MASSTPTPPTAPNVPSPPRTRLNASELRVQVPRWEALPEDVFDRVTKQLCRGEDGNSALRDLHLVNKHWSRCTAKALSCIKPKDLQQTELSDFLKRLKTTFVNVSRLDMPVVWFDDDCCRKLAKHAPNLATLELFWGDNITDEGLKELASMQLKALRIYHSRLLGDEGIAALARSSIEELWLYGANQVTDDGFRKLEQLNSLKNLRLMYCNRLTRCGLDPLFKRTGLQIFVRFCRRISCEISIS